MATRYARTYVDVAARDHVVLIFSYEHRKNAYGTLHIWVNPFKRIPVNSISSIGGLVAISAVRKMRELEIRSLRGQYVEERDWEPYVQPDSRFDHHELTGSMVLVPPKQCLLRRHMFTDLCKMSIEETIATYNLTSWRTWSLHK
jgi:hypothetical protein